MRIAGFKSNYPDCLAIKKYHLSLNPFGLGAQTLGPLSICDTCKVVTISGVAFKRIQDFTFFIVAIGEGGQILKHSEQVVVQIQRQPNIFTP